MVVISNKREKSRMIAQLFKEEKWAEARTYFLGWLKEEPDSHWLLAQLSETYCEERKYEKALEYIEQALKIAPRCPLVLWDYATTLDMLDRNEDALKVYKGLIRRGVYRIAYGECGEGIRWARSLVNDCRYRLGLLYAGMGEFRLASKYIKTHIANRSRNCPSIYNVRDVKKKLAIILEGKDPRSC
ncbi:tetratricopeptide repeat protein [Chloroflexota bacterium]